MEGLPAFERVQLRFPDLPLSLLTRSYEDLESSSLYDKAWHAAYSLCSAMAEVARFEVPPRTERLHRRKCLDCGMTAKDCHDAGEKKAIERVIDIAQVFMELVTISGGIVGYEFALTGFWSLATSPRAFDQALHYFFQLATVNLQKIRSRSYHLLMMEHYAAHSDDEVLLKEIATHWSTHVRKGNIV